MYSVNEFAQKIKDKYPAYQNIDNKVLVNKILEKYPVYKDQVNLGQPRSEETKQKVGVTDVLKEVPGAAKQIGVGALKGLASTISGISQLGQKGLNATMGKLVGQQPIYKLPESLTEGKNQGERAGKAIEQVAEYFIPGGAASKATKAINATSKLGKVATKLAVEGGSIGAITSAQTGDIKEGAKSGLIGGGAMAGISGASKAVSKIAQAIPETAWSAILKRTPTSALKNPQLEKQIAQEGVVGITKKSISAKLGKEIQNLELAITDSLKAKEGEIPTKSVVDKLIDLRQRYSTIPGESNAVETIDNIGQELLAKGEKITVQAANELKRNIYGLIEKSYGKGLLEVPAKTEAQKMIARGLKTEIEKVIPEVKDINAKMAIFIQTKKAIDQTIARETGKGIGGLGIGLFDILAGLGGGIWGATKAGVVGSLAMPATIAIKKVAESPAALTTISKGTQKMINYFGTLSPTQRVMFYSALRGLVGESNK